MKTLNYDVVVIGSGPAGEKAALEAVKHNAKVAIIEKSQTPGGASLITGTIPSKAIRETVQHIHMSKMNALSGINLTISQELTMENILHRKNLLAMRLSEKLKANLIQKGVELIHGTAQFKNKNSIIVDSDGDHSEAMIIKSNNFIIAVGCSPYHPPDITFDGERILDSDTILNLIEFPKSIIIYGGGVIGCEYASIFSSLGVRVHLVNPLDRLLKFVDSDISLHLAYKMQQSGISFKFGETYKTATNNGDHVEMLLNSGKLLRASCLLYCNGRKGNADGLNAEKAGLIINSKCQLDVDESYRTIVKNIYAVGDVIGFPSMASTGKEQGRKAAQHAVLGKVVTGEANLSPLGIYTIPEIGMVGKTEEELTNEKIPYEIGICSFTELAKANLIGAEDGLFKLIFHQEDLRLLGVHIIGNSSTELVHIGQAVIQFKGTINYFIDSVLNYPTLTQAYKIAVMDGLERLKGI